MKTIEIERNVHNPPYGRKTLTYYIRAVNVTNDIRRPETGTLLRQTALQQFSSPNGGGFAKFKGDPELEWHEDYIESYDEVEPGYARVIIIEPYLD